MSEIRRVNTGDAPRNVYHAGDAPRTVNTGRTVKTGSALNQDEYEAARRRAQQLAANNTRRTRSFNRVQQTDVDRYRAAQQKEQEARAAAAQQQAAGGAPQGQALPGLGRGHLLPIVLGLALAQPGGKGNHRQQRHAADVVAHRRKGAGAQMVHPHALGHKGRAPNQGGEHQQCRAPQLCPVTFHEPHAPFPLGTCCPG